MFSGSDSQAVVSKLFSELRRDRGSSIRPLPMYRCCRWCAIRSIRIGAAMAARPEQYPTGFIYYTRQDDAAATNGTLRIGFGDIRPQSAARPFDTEIGRILVDGLTKGGLCPVWDGDPKRRVVLPVIGWHKYEGEDEESYE